jgi:Ca-activated chloride channel family protein
MTKTRMIRWGVVVAMAAVGLTRAEAEERGRTSPSDVLRKVDATLGAQSVHFPPTPRDRQDTGEDKTLSPYFYVAGGDPETERLPLKETSAKVNIAGVIAKVQVRQVFENTGGKPIEAVYVFPASTRAAVHGMRMTIGKRTVEAKIEKKAEARAQYEQAKQQGKRASLLEQERPNVFTMSVANIMPRDRIQVELDYSELLVPTDAVYEFVYPTVVGPRYGGGADPKKDKWIANPYLQEGEKEPYKFDISVHLETGIPIKELSSPSHKVAVSYSAKNAADVKLDQEGGGNKDYILRYRLAGDQVETGVLLWQGEKENFFVLMMEPPQRPTDAQIPPREYIFLLDVSGSMHGFPLETAKALMSKLLSQLRPSDSLNVALFSGSQYVMHPNGSVPATPRNIQDAIDVIQKQTGGGGTELMGGLRMSYAVPKREANVSRSVIVVTDGYVGVEAQAFKFIREHLDEANLFAFGIGSSVNRGLIEGMARAGMGEPFVVLNPSKAAEQAEKLREYIQYPVLSNISVTFPGFNAREVAPMKVPDLMARRPVIVFGKYEGGPQGKIQVTGATGGGKRITQALEVSEKSIKPENHPIRWLWARKWVSILDDEMHLSPAKEIEEAITDLGLTYKLLTTFTSFVAVDSEVVNRTGQSDTVNQPLPLPDGVSNLAVGGSAEAKVKRQAVPVQAMPAVMPSSPAPPAAEAEYDAPSGFATRSDTGRVAKGGGAKPSPEPSPKDAKAEEKSPTKAPSLRFAVLASRATGLTDEKALLDALQKRLAEVVKACGTEGATLKIRLTVDKSGKVVKVEVVEAADAKLGKCVQGKVTGITSGARPAGDTGTLEVSLKVVAP